MTDLEQRLRGGLLDLAAHAPKGADPGLHMTSLDNASRRRRNMFIAVSAAAAVVAVAVGAPVLASRLADPASSRPNVAESGGTPAPTTVETSAGQASQATVDQVAQSLAAHADEPGYGKVVVDYEMSIVRLYWKGPRPADLVESAQSNIRGVRVEVIEAKYSVADLEAAGTQAAALLRASDRQVEVAATMPNETLSGLVVEIVRPWSGSVRAVEEQIGVPITVRLVDEGPVPAAE